MSGIGTLGDKASVFCGTPEDGEGLGHDILSGWGRDATGTGGLLALKAGIGAGDGERDDEGEPNCGEGDFGHSKGQSGSGDGVSLSLISSESLSLEEHTGLDLDLSLVSRDSFGKVGEHVLGNVNMSFLTGDRQ